MEDPRLTHLKEAHDHLLAKILEKVDESLLAESFGGLYDNMGSEISNDVRNLLERIRTNMKVINIPILIDYYIMI